jgi:hypothetical protein
MSVNSSQKTHGYRDVIYNINSDKIFTSAEGDNYTEIDIAAGTDGSSIQLGDIYIIACSDETGDLEVSQSVASFIIPTNGILTAVEANVNTASQGADIKVDIKQNSTSLLSTVITIDSGETSSSTASTPAVISNSNITRGSKITIDINQIGTTAYGAGLKVTLHITRLS